VRAALNGDLGALPGATGRALGPELAQATLASLALLLAAFAVSAIAGIWLGRRSVRADPPAVRARLVGPASIGVALPAFYVGAALIAGAILLASQTDRAIVVPTVGLNLGWPMLLPIAALALRPTLQLALFSAGLLAAEAGKPYARAARSLGFDWRTLQGRLLFRNTLLPIAAFLAASFRVIVAELVVVEWLFEWPGIGRLLAWRWCRRVSRPRPDRPRSFFTLPCWRVCLPSWPACLSPWTRSARWPRSASIRGRRAGRKSREIRTKRSSDGRGDPVRAQSGRCRFRPARRAAGSARVQLCCLFGRHADQPAVSALYRR
jgi:hypothetical protein